MHAVHSNWLLTINVWFIFTVWNLTISKLDNFMFHNFDMEQGEFRRSWSLLFDWLIDCVFFVLFEDIFSCKETSWNEDLIFKHSFKQHGTEFKSGYDLLFIVVIERDWLLQCGIGGRLLEQPILHSSSFFNTSR